MTVPGRQLLWTWFGASSVMLFVILFDLDIVLAALVTVGGATLGELIVGVVSS